MSGADRPGEGGGLAQQRKCYRGRQNVRRMETRTVRHHVNLPGKFPFVSAETCQKVKKV